MTEIVKRNDIDMAMLEQVVVGGNLKDLSPAQRLDYYRNVCQSVGLNPLTRPFDYITLNGKLTLYAKKDATDQLRKIHGISISKPDMQYVDDVIMVAVSATDRTGRSDADVGVVTVGGLKGDNKANAIMKAITKAKRRVTLSMAGLGWLDETELDTIPDARPIMVNMETGEILMSQQNGLGTHANSATSKHATTQPQAQQRPIQQAKSNPVPQDENFYPTQDEGIPFGHEDNPFNDPPPFAWPTSSDALEICAGYRDTLTSGDVADMIDKWRSKNQTSNGPLSIQNKDGKGGGQYGAMAGKLGERYGKGSHAAILSAICGRVVSRENPPGWKLKELLDLWDTGGLDVSVFDSFVEVLKQELQQLEVA